MSRKNSKQKGNTFERDIANLLTERLGTQFRRVPNSGAFMGGTNKNKNENVRNDAKEILSGDIIAGSENFPFSIECKFYENEPQFHQILNGGSKKLDEWINQAESDAKFINKHSLIFFKINRKGTFVCVDKDLHLLPKIIENPILIYKNKVIFSIDFFFNLLLTPNKNSLESTKTSN